MLDLQPPREVKSLLVSVLSLGRAQDVLALTTNLPQWLSEFAQDAGILVHIVVHNNDPNVDFDEVRQRFAQCERDYPVLRCTLVTGQPNVGFGGGHNANYRMYAADYLLILNDDIGFPHLDWLPEAVQILALDPQVACVGATENPQYLNPMFGHGQANPTLAVETLKYAEASVLLFSGRIFERIGMFDERLQWAMSEDADLSLRAQQLGYHLRWISMPHEHWRSKSVNSLPEVVRSSILEHNRATLFASWSQALATGRIGRLEVFDLWSDGMGDVFCALPHICAWLETMPPERRRRIVINTNHTGLVETMGVTDVRITCEADRNGLLQSLDGDGVTALHSTRDINYALPMNIHPLLCSTLGLPMCDTAPLEKFRWTVQHGGDIVLEKALPEIYCVLHLEFSRDHHGRGLTPTSMQSILARCTRLFKTIVLIGRERRLSVRSTDRGAGHVIDMQGKLSLKEMISVIGRATYFVGIDSFPAHVAQAAGVRSAIFFGSVHPLARVWNEVSVWPLLAELDCIGCYHTHLEPSAPYCMRRDQACCSGPEKSGVDRILQAMQANEPYVWYAQRRRFEALQAKWMGFMRHHPSPPERVLRPAVAGNEQTSNMIYRILGHAAELAVSQYTAASMTGLRERVREMEAELFAREVELDEARHAPRNVPPQEFRAVDETLPLIQIIQLKDLDLRQDRCTTHVSGQWLEIQALDEDPQLHLPAIKGYGGRLQFRLVTIANHVDTLQVYWRFDKGNFTEEQQCPISVGPQSVSTDLPFDIAAGQYLELRIDPLLGRGKLRLRGSVSGAFALVDTNQNGGAPSMGREDPMGDARNARRKRTQRTTITLHGDGPRRHRKNTH